MTDAPARRDRPPRPCPVCKKMSLPQYHPFCSRRCADVDLSRWFSEVYAAPAGEHDEEAPPPAPKDERDV